MFSSEVHNSHGAKEWKVCAFFLCYPRDDCKQIERVLSIGLLGLIPAAIFAPSQAVDMAIAVVLPIHNHL